jgi:putative acetyltransferase
MLVIRPAVESDFGAIGRVFHDAVRQIAKRDYTEEQVRAWSPGERDAAHWQRRTAKLEVRVAELESVVAGFIGFSHSGYIDLLFVRPEFVRRGIAKALLLDAERALGQLRVKTAWTEASLTARGFFQAMGYGTMREQSVCRGGVELRNCRMEKTLTQPSRRAEPGDDAST